MELKLNVGYGQVWELIDQLSDRDIEQLMKQVQSKFKNHDTERIPMQELILQAPTWTDEEYYSYMEVRDHIL